MTDRPDTSVNSEPQAPDIDKSVNSESQTPEAEAAAGGGRRPLLSHSLMSFLLIIARVAFGATFLFSGFVKAVDPMGSAYKFIDYFRAFDLMALAPLAVAMAVLLAALEFATGACVLLGLMRRTAAGFGLLFMAFFTPLTLWLALTNPVKDCGCFGDALVLTNWQTFYKNLVLLALAIWIFIKRRELLSPFEPPLRGYVALFALLFPIGVAQYGLSHTPMLDFRPFKQGVNIPQAMSRNTVESIYQLIYRDRTGVEHVFSLDNYPADDPEWEFVDARLINPTSVKEPTIVDFFLTDAEGQDVTDDILLDSGYTFLLISPDWRLANDDHIDKVNEMFEFARERGYAFYGVSVADQEREAEWREGTGAEYPMLYSDATVLETVVRPNPGMVLLHDGTIVWKRNTAQLPTSEELAASLDELQNGGKIKKIDEGMRILWAVLLFFGPILLLLSFEKTVLFLLYKLRARRKQTIDLKNSKNT